MGFRIEYWRLQPLALPVVWRHCACCRTSQAFLCNERFRVNAQKKVLDVWLLYRCSECAGVWKFPVLSRCRVTELDPAVRAAFERDDPDMVQRHACDLTRLRQQVMRVQLSEH